MQKLLSIFFYTIFLNFFQQEESVFYIVDQKKFVRFNEKDEKTKVSFKYKYDFYFSLKNDSIALVQDIYNGKPGKTKEYRISKEYDTTYAGHYIIEEGKNILNGVEKLVYRKIFPISQ